MNLKQDIDKQIFHLIGQAADEMGREAYVVGGYVRDIFLNRTSKDIDFVTVGSGIELAQKVASLLGKGAHLSVFATYGTAQVKWKGLELEFVGARKESYTRDSRNPIVENGTLEDDQKRRDFTINAMAICVNGDRFGELVDPFNGLIDLHHKTIRTPMDPDITFSDDPLRMMRAIRFATQLEFEILPETYDAIVRNKERIEIITKERINDELGKIIRSRRPSIGFTLLETCGLLELIFPELHALKGVDTMEGKGHKDNFYHTLQVVDNICDKTDNEWLRWAALLHDIAKPVTKRYDAKLGWTFHNHNYIGEKMIPRIFRKMKMPSNEKMKYVAKLVGMHMRPQSIGEDGVTDSAVRRMMFDAGEDLSGRTAEEVFYADYKVFRQGEIQFGVAQGNFNSRANLVKTEEIIKNYIGEMQKTTGVDMVYYIATSIPEKTSDVLFAGKFSAELLEIAFGAEKSGDKYVVEGLMSRKKQFVPQMLKAIQQEAEMLKKNV